MAIAKLGQVITAYGFKGMNNLPEAAAKLLDRERQITPQVILNADVTDGGVIKARGGYVLTKALTNCHSLVGEESGLSVMLCVADGITWPQALYLVEGTTATELCEVTGPRFQVSYAEINNVIYASNPYWKATYNLLTGTAGTWGIPLPPAPDIVLVAGDLPPGTYSLCYTNIVGDRLGGNGPLTKIKWEGGAQGILLRNLPTGALCWITHPNGEKLFLAQTSDASPELVTNGDFEAGLMDWAGWNLTGVTDFAYVNDAFNNAQAFTPPSPQLPYSGTYETQFGATGYNIPENYAFISQTLPTIPGRLYSLKFHLSNDAYPGLGVDNNPNHFGVNWADVLVMSLDDVMQFPYREYDLTVVASGSSTELKFEFLNNNGYFYFDLVSVKGNTVQGSADQITGASPWLKPLPTFMVQPPPGFSHFIYAFGRIWGALGKKIYYSDPHQYEWFRPANFLPFLEDIVLVAPATGGLFVSSLKNTWYLDGTDPLKMDVRRVGNGAVPGTLTMVQVAANIAGGAQTSDIFAQLSKMPTPVWMSPTGWVVGSHGGNLTFLTENRMSIVPRTNGASLYRIRNGIPQVLSSMWGLPTGEDSLAEIFERGMIYIPAPAEVIGSVEIEVEVP